MTMMSTRIQLNRSSNALLKMKVNLNCFKLKLENEPSIPAVICLFLLTVANMEAFSEMLGNHNICVRHDPR